jgi:hypothetical protein
MPTLTGVVMVLLLLDGAVMGFVIPSSRNIPKERANGGEGWFFSVRDKELSCCYD